MTAKKERASWPMKDWEVRAIRDGGKTQHRMPVKQKLTPLAGESNWYQFDHRGLNYRVNARHTTVGAFAQLLQFHPYGQPGDRLWVREAFRFPESLDSYAPRDAAMKALAAGYNTPWAPTQFEADGQRTGNWIGFDTPPFKTKPGKLRPATHMPEWVSRTTLEIVGVRVERLQDISEADAVAEGVSPECIKAYDRAGVARPAGFAYRDIWIQRHGIDSWDASDWVWVPEFKVV